MDECILSCTTFSDFQCQVETVLDIFHHLSSEDKVRASFLWNAISVKITRRDSNFTSEKNSEGTAHDHSSTSKGIHNVHNPAEISCHISTNKVESSGTMNEKEPESPDEDDRLNAKGMDEIIPLESYETSNLFEENSLKSSWHGNYPNIPQESQEWPEEETNIPASVPAEEQKTLQCSSCCSIFNTEEMLQEHSLQFHGVKDRPFKCPHCPASFASRGNRNVHLRSSTHTGEKPFECSKCNARFGTSSNLRRHILSHQGLKPYRCSTCQACFTEKRSLIIHSRKHTGERPFACPQCAKTFMQKNVLQNHIRTHSNEKTFSCNLCSKSFTQKAHLLRHSQYVHRGVKNKICTDCNMQFVTKSDLDRHLKSKSHAGEQTFLCAQCGKRFMRQANLTEHMNAIHKKIYPPKC